MHAVSRVAIVGGGSVGISFLAQLIAHLQTRMDSQDGIPACCITVFDPAEKLGHGTAYQHDLNTNLLNVPAGNMSLYDKHRLHFVQWLAEQSDAFLHSYAVNDIDPSAFYPRPLFGRYVQEQFAHIVAQADALGIAVRVVRRAVVAVNRCQTELSQEQVATGPKIASSRNHIQSTTGPPDETQQQAPSPLQLTDAAGVCHEFDQLILCNGNLASDKFGTLAAHVGYIPSPYPVSALSDTIPVTASVAILGSNLSAIDAVVALKALQHKGPIHCFSRQGVLPAVRSVHPTHLPNRLSRDDVHALAQAKGGTLSLDDVVALLHAQMLAVDPAFDVGDMAGEGANAVEQLNRELHAASNGARPWQAVLAAANEVIDLLWLYLDRTDRKQFLSRWRSLWMSRRAMFPMQNARQLKHLIDQGQLQIHGGFQACEPLEDRPGFVMRWQDADGATQQHICDVVINATGFSQDVVHSSDPLVLQLLQSGMARASEYGGFELDFDTGSLLTAAGDIAHDMTVLGSLACGTYFWTVSMDVNARLADEQAARLADVLWARQQGVAARGLAAAAAVPDSAASITVAPLSELQ